MSARFTALPARPPQPTAADAPPDPGSAASPPDLAGSTATPREPTEPLTPATAHEIVADQAFRESSGGLIGLELEFHLVDLRDPARRPTWDAVQQLLADLPDLPNDSRVTLEPGGQVELSTPPAAGISGSIDLLCADRGVLRDALRQRGYGTAPLGADPARPPARINPSPRYQAMEAHFDALGCGPWGRAMMTSSAALQLNLDAGQAAGWAERVRRVHDLGPVLVAVSACSPWLGGQRSGWRSMRQQTWRGIDRRRTDPFTLGSSAGKTSRPNDDPAALNDPAAAWADYALNAPVLALRAGDSVHPVYQPVPFAEWVARPDVFGRPPTAADVELHLTTLFPVVRPRGYLELRYLDAQPDRWWPALATVVATLADDPLAADRAAEVCAPVRDRWLTAAQEGLADPELHAAARDCLRVAVERCPPARKADVEAYAELVDAGRTPGDDVADRIAATDPLTVLEEEARA